MEFSETYSTLMETLATRFGDRRELITSNNVRESLIYSAMLKVDIKDICEIPIITNSVVESKLRDSINNEEVQATLVYPLFVGPYFKQCAGAETMLKYFSREYRGRINKATTPKGEVYYGNAGIILDSNFNPLMIATVKIQQNGTTHPDKLEYIIHLHPNVFIDDTKIINKSLAKKGVAYYLSHSMYDWLRHREIPYKIEIDDCSQFIVKAHRPDVEHCTNQDFNNVLKQNIDEILSQVKDDYRRHL